tara:strand:+ start:1068 stop:1262 length:195 start_codon:yes stop_codon:yes gene_type:complete
MMNSELQTRLEELASEMIDLLASHGGEGWMAAIGTADTTWSVMIADNPITGVELMEAYVSSLDL